jgi:hypothetical protein
MRFATRGIVSFYSAGVVIQGCRIGSKYAVVLIFVVNFFSIFL